MPYESLLGDDRIEEHTFTPRDLEQYMAIAVAKLQDAKVEGHSDDTTFTLAYDAVRPAAEAVMAAEGFKGPDEDGRLRGHVQHAAVFEFLGEVGDGRWEEEAGRFNRARRKRNVSQYDRFGLISATQAADLVADAEAFISQVEDWLQERGLLPKA